MYQIRLVVCDFCGAPRHGSEVVCEFDQTSEGVTIKVPYIVTDLRKWPSPVCELTDSELEFELGKPNQDIERHTAIRDEIARRATLGDLAAWYLGAEHPSMKSLTRAMARHEAGV